MNRYFKLLRRVSMKKAEIGVIRFVTDNPKNSDEWGALEVEIHTSAEPDLYRTNYSELTKILTPVDDE